MFKLVLSLLPGISSLKLKTRCQKNATCITEAEEFTLLQPATLLKRRLWQKCFPVNFEKFQRILFLREHLQWLILNCMRFAKCKYNYCIYLYMYTYNTYDNFTMKEKTYFLLLKPRNLFLNYFFLVWFLHIGYVFRTARNLWNLKCGFGSSTFDCLLYHFLQI